MKMRPVPLWLRPIRVPSSATARDESGRCLPLGLGDSIFDSPPNRFASIAPQFLASIHLSVLPPPAPISFAHCAPLRLAQSRARPRVRSPRFESQTISARPSQSVNIRSNTQLVLDACLISMLCSFVFAPLQFEISASHPAPLCEFGISAARARISSPRCAPSAVQAPSQAPVLSSDCKRVRNSLRKLVFKFPCFHTHPHSFPANHAFTASSQKHTRGVYATSPSLEPLVPKFRGLTERRDQTRVARPCRSGSIAIDSAEIT